MEQFPQKIVEQFKSPQEELNFLREQVKQKEALLASKQELLPREQVVENVVGTYKTQPKEVLHESMQMSKKEQESITLNLTPEAHDSKIGQLLALLREKGIKNTLAVVEGLNDPHLADDFHRFLVEYVAAGYPVLGLTEGSSIFKAVSMALFEVTLPRAKENEKKPLKEMLSSMEQFFAGMLSIASAAKNENNYFTIELAIENHSEEFIFYVSVPLSKVELFEKQALSIFHEAKVVRKHDDYNIFNPDGVTVGAVAELKNHTSLPIKTYEQFDLDPINVLINSFSKIDKVGEGAAIQIVVKPAGDTHQKNVANILKQLEKGDSFKDATATVSVGSFLKDIAKEFSSKKKDEAEKPKPREDSKIEQIRAKMSSPIMETNIRILTSSRTEAEAKAILEDIKSSFNQFENTLGNKFVFEQVQKRHSRNLKTIFLSEIFLKKRCCRFQ